MGALWTRRRRAILLLAGLGSAALLAATLLWFPSWSHRMVVSELESVFGRTVTAEAVRFRFFPAEMEVRGLRVAGEHDGDPPWMEVPRLSILPSFGLIWERRIVLSRVRIERPLVRITADAEGGDNLPRLNMGGRGVFGVRIRRLTIEGGELILDHQRVPLELDLPELTGRLIARRAGILAGRVTMGPGQARFGSAPPIELETQLDLVMDGPHFILENGRVHTARSDLHVQGELRLVHRPEGRYQISGPLDLDELDRHVTRTGFNLTGVARYRGDLQIEGSKLTLNGELQGEKGSWKGAEVPRFAGRVAWTNEDGVEVRGLELSAFGGTARLDLDVPPAGRKARLAGHLEGLDADPTVARLFQIGLNDVGARATGDVDLEWPRGRFREVTGRVALDLIPATDARSPLRGRFTWSARGGVQQLEHVDLRTPETQVLLHGRIGRGGDADLALTAHSSDLAASDARALRLRHALGNARAALFEVSGTGSFDGRWKGTINAPVYEGRVTAADVHYLGVDWGHASWVGRASADEIACHSLVLQKGSAELWIDGTLQPGTYGASDGVDVRTRLDAWPVEDLSRALAWDVPWTGPVSGQTQIHGRRSAPYGTAALSGTAGRYGGLPYESLSVDALLQGDRLQVTRGEAGVGGGRLHFEGTRTDAGEYDGSARAEGVEIGDFLPEVQPGMKWGGHVAGEATLRGTLETPTLKARLQSRRLFLGEEGVGALEADLTGAGDGRLIVKARCTSPRTHLEVEGAVGAAAPFAASLTVTGQKSSVDPYVRAFLPAGSALPSIIASGRAQLDGPLQRPADLAASIDLPELQVLISDYPVRNEGPARLELAGGTLTVRALRLAGEGTNLLASGEAQLLRDGPVDFSVKGDADLRSLATLTRRFRGRGAAELAVAVRGTRDAPHVDGSLHLLGAGVRVRGFPLGIEDVQGSVKFTERAAQLTEISGRLGGGEVHLGGETAYARSGLTSMDLTLSGRDVALRYPEGLRSVTSGELRLFGDGERQWLTGDLDVHQAVWTRRYDVVSEILAAPETLAAPATLGEALRFDIKVNAPGTVKIDNNLATLDARADLRLQGTSDNPIVLGRADVDRGRVYFQGNTYLIRRGRIEFANPQHLDPFFDIEAETRLASYRVHLRMNGTLERVYPTLTSDPPLSAVQILNLLAGAEESDVASLAEAQTERARLAGQGAASLAAGRIAEGVGLERQAERLFGLNRFSIDPSVLKGGVTHPAARITVGKRLTPDLNVLYSQDLRGSEERLLSVEYTLRDWLSVLMTRSEPGGFGVDALIQRSR
jgi:translocation and assembly module TamB